MVADPALCQATLGIEVRIRDDDNGGDRDTRRAWYALVGNDNFRLNPSLFGQGILAPDLGFGN